MSKQTRNNIKYEIEKESSRFVCPNYQGVIFVHPDDVGYTVNTMLPYTESLKVQRNTVTLKRGGSFIIRTAGGKQPHFDYAGMQLTSVLLSMDCFGKYMEEYVGTVSPSEFIPYVCSRLHGNSQFHSHMVIF